MKKVMFLLLMLAFTFSTRAQTSNTEDLPPAKERSEMMTELMTEKLQLSDDQIPKVEKINYNFAVEMDKVVKLSDRRSKLKAARSAQSKKDKELKGVLNSEQYKEYEQYKEELKKKMKEKMKEKRS